MRTSFYKLLPLLGLIIFIAGCSSRPVTIGFPEAKDSAPARQLDPNAIADAVPRYEPKSRRGNPSSYVVFGKRYYVKSSSQGYTERGIASWYGTKFHGRSTSSGEPYDMYAMTAAHKSLPLPTYVQVTNLKNGRQAIVKVNDRGPFHDNRIIDLSYAAATKLGILGNGTGWVEVKAIDTRGGVRQATYQKPQPVTTNRNPIKLPTEPVKLGLYVQVGAFSTRANANQLSQKISLALNESVRVQETTVSGTPFYRVQVGPFSSVEQVDLLTQQLPPLGIGATQVVID